MTFRMDPRAKLYLLLLANLMLLFHVGTGAEAAATALCLLLFFLSGKARAGVQLSVLYFGLLAVDLFVVPRAGESVLLNLLSLVSVGVRMMLPCIITGASSGSRGVYAAPCEQAAKAPRAIHCASALSS